MTLSHGKRGVESWPGRRALKIAAAGLALAACSPDEPGDVARGGLAQGDTVSAEQSSAGRRTSPDRLLELSGVSVRDARSRPAERSSDPSSRDASATCIEAASRGRWREVTSCSNSAPQVLQATGLHGRTLLMYAAASSDPEHTARLLRAGADASVADDSGNTALFFLPESDDPSSTRLLLAAGADVNARNSSGATPLLAAAMLGYEQIVHALLAAGASTNVRDLRGTSPLAAALRRGHLVLAGRLYDETQSLPDQLGELAAPILTRAAELGEQASLLWMLERLESESDCGSLLSAGLFAAISARQQASTRLLLDARPSCRSSCDSEGLGPLHRAAAIGSPTIVATLLEDSGADRVACDPFERTPLHLAAQEGHAEIVRSLLEVGASVDATTEAGITPLMYAARRGEDEAVRILLAAGAEVGRENRAGHTPLVFAVVYRHVSVVRALLDAGASPSGRYRIEAFGRITPLALAAGRGHAEIARALIHAGADLEEVSDVPNVGRLTALLLAARHRHRDLVQELLAAGAKSDVLDREGRSYSELLVLSEE